MPSESSAQASARSLLSPLVSSDLASDARVLDALVTAEVALVRAWAAVGVAPTEASREVEATFGWLGRGELCSDHGIDLADIATRVAHGGNPVIPLVPAMRERVSPSAAAWIHRAATSQDILDTALMLLAAAAARATVDALTETELALTEFAREHRDVTAPARTLTQHAVPTTVGLRASTWVRAVRRARDRLAATVASAPAQCGGAAGTLAAAAEVSIAAGVPDAVTRLPAALATELGLAAPEAPWHTTRWPVTELGDALASAIDAVGVFAANVTLLARPEIGEVAVAHTGGSSAMAHKRNPTQAVLIRSAAIRAPHLAATLHSAASAAVDERPDGAWHAEWHALHELALVALGASQTAAALATGLHLEPQAVARNLDLSRSELVTERLTLVLTPLIGADRVTALVAQAIAGGDLAEAIRALPEARELDVDALLNPANYVGLAGSLTDAIASARREP